MNIKKENLFNSKQVHVFLYVCWLHRQLRIDLDYFDLITIFMFDDCIIVTYELINIRLNINLHLGALNPSNWSRLNRYWKYS